MELRMELATTKLAQQCIAAAGEGLQRVSRQSMFSECSNKVLKRTKAPEPRLRACSGPGSDACLMLVAVLRVVFCPLPRSAQQQPSRKGTNSKPKRR